MSDRLTEKQILERTQTATIVTLVAGCLALTTSSLPMTLKYVGAFAVGGLGKVVETRMEGYYGA